MSTSNGAAQATRDCSGPVDDGVDGRSSPADMDRICALAAEATVTLRPYASWMSQEAIVIFAAEVVTTLLAALVPPEDVKNCIGCVTVGLCATIDGTAENVTDEPGG